MRALKTSRTGCIAWRTPCGTSSLEKKPTMTTLNGESGPRRGYACATASDRSRPENEAGTRARGGRLETTASLVLACRPGRRQAALPATKGPNWRWLPAGSRPGARRPGATAPAATSLSAIFRAAAGWPGPRDLSRAAAHLPDPVNRGMSLEAIAAMLAQSRRTCRLPGCPARVGRHVNSAANRAVITTAADHPSWGDAWVVRRTARCGSLEERSR